MSSAAAPDSAGIRIDRLDRGGIAEAARVLAASLVDEPGFVSVYPDAARRRDVMGRLMDALLRDAIAFRHVWVALDGEEILGVAVWFPPGAYPPTLGRNLRLAPRVLPLLRHGPGRFLGLIAMEGNAERHHPKEPVWYLAALGVAPGRQGRGIGSRLLAPVLEMADARGEPAYLETGEEINVRFYQRAGFEVRDPAVRIAPAPGPTHWTMYRPAHTP